MTTTEHAHIQNILDDPLNDGIEGPRGVYADWLDERGHGDDRERAAFIRWQLAHPESFARQNALFDSDVDVASPMPPDFGVPQGEVTVRRGFPYSITCTLATLFGGECDCGLRVMDVATGRDIIVYRPSTCPSCKGAGRTEGIARDVFSRWPILTVNVTDFRWRFMTDDSFQASDMPGWDDDLMRAVYVAVAKGVEPKHAMSDAAVNYGRERAGLRPIAWVNS